MKAPDRFGFGTSHIQQIAGRLAQNLEMIFFDLVSGIPGFS